MSLLIVGRCSACREPLVVVTICPRCGRAHLCAPCALRCVVQDVWAVRPKAAA